MLRLRGIIVMAGIISLSGCMQPVPYPENTLKRLERLEEQANASRQPPPQPRSFAARSSSLFADSPYNWQPDPSFLAQQPMTASYQAPPSMMTPSAPLAANDLMGVGQPQPLPPIAQAAPPQASQAIQTTNDLFSQQHLAHGGALPRQDAPRTLESMMAEQRQQSHYQYQQRYADTHNLMTAYAPSRPVEMMPETVVVSPPVAAPVVNTQPAVQKPAMASAPPPAPPPAMAKVAAQPQRQAQQQPRHQIAHAAPLQQMQPSHADGAGDVVDVANMYFSANNARLREQDVAVLQQVARHYQQRGGTVMLSASAPLRTDEGLPRSEDDALAMAGQQANVVAQTLVQYGVPMGKIDITTQAYNQRAQLAASVAPSLVLIQFAR